MADSKYTLPRGYLSASQIDRYLKCPKQYEFAYIKEIKSPPEIAMLKGSAAHKGFEVYYQEKMSGSRLTPNQVVEFAVLELRELAKTQELKIQDTEENEVIESLENVIETYITSVGERTEPEATEKEIDYYTSENVKVIGYLDLLRKPSEEEVGVITDSIICDYKITGRKWTADRLKNSLQFNIYALATGLPNVEIHNVVDTTKKTDIYIIGNRFDGKEYNHLETIINSVAQGISAGYFPPCSLDSWWCNPTWCGYYHMCRGKG